MYRKLILLAAVLLFALPHAHADEATKRAKIEEMFTIIKMDSLMNQMMDQGLTQGKQAAKAAVGDRPLTAADQKLMDDFLTKIFAIVSDELGWPKLKPAFTDLYASAYTEAEIDGILAFYKSPVGQTLLAKTPELIIKSGQIAAERMKEVGPRMQEAMADLQKQLAASHHDKPATN